MVCCCLLETLVCFALLNRFLPDQLTVCDLGVCKLGPGGCECFILKRVLYDWFLSVSHWDYTVVLTVVSTYSFTCSSASLLSVIIACI